MHIEIFRQAALENIELDLSHLIKRSCDRFLRAASLLEIRGPVIKNLQAFYCEKINYESLLRPHNIIIQRYINEIYSPQLDLIDAAESEGNWKWHKFFYYQFIPLVLSDNEALKNILRAAKAIPSSDFSQNIDSLCQIYSDLTLPDTQPLWAKECNYNFRTK